MVVDKLGFDITAMPLHTQQDKMLHLNPLWVINIQKEHNYYCMLIQSVYCHKHCADI